MLSWLRFLQKRVLYPCLCFYKKYMKKNTGSFITVVVLSAFFASLLGGIVGFALADGAVDDIREKFGFERGDEQKISLNSGLGYSVEDRMVAVVEQVSKSVVSVVGRGEVENGQFIELGGGSGFVVGKSGLILTNKHVVLSDAAKYFVIFPDGREYQVASISRDPFDDVAVLQLSEDDVPEEGFVALELALGEEIKVGQKVVAIGNALARYGNTVTEGIVSGLGREIFAYNDAVARAENLFGLIQTDAAINRGNSGGPLVNIDGKVVGMNVAVDEGANSIGFAIPANDLAPIVRSIEKYGEINRPVLGARFLMLNEQQAKELGMDVSSGALIVGGDLLNEPAVIPGGPAEKADLKEGDVVLQIDDILLDEENLLHHVIRSYDPSDEVTLKVWREGAILDIRVTLGSSKDL